jgi:hypothetical protein
MTQLNHEFEFMFADIQAQQCAEGCHKQVGRKE